MQRRRPRILLAENHPQWSAHAKAALEGAGYDVTVATNTGDARALLDASRAAPVDLAVFDLRLDDDAHPYDHSGLKIARDYPALRRVIWTAEDKNGQVVVDAHRDGIHVSLKTEGVPNLVQVVKNALAARVFLVHGHDSFKDAVRWYLTSLGLEVIVLADEPGGSRTVIEMLERSTVEYAVALLTPDDEGRRRETPGQPAEALRLRARQNVVFELGLFSAALGRHNVFALCAQDIELPSDWGGVRFITYGQSDEWQRKLRDEFKAAHVPISDARR